MRETAALFRGMHDFRSFTDDDPARTSTRVLVEGLELAEDGDLVLVRMVASHFLWKMVRRVVGVIAEVGRGDLRPDDAARFLREPSDVPGPPDRAPLGPLPGARLLRGRSP